MDDSQELWAQISPPIGESGLAGPVLPVFALGAESARRRDNFIALEYGENRVRRSLATRIRDGLLLQKCAEQMGQLHLRVNAIGRSRSIFGEFGKLVN